MTSPSFEREAMVTMSSWRCARMQSTMRPCHSVYTKGRFLALRPRSRSGWISRMRKLARSPRIPAPTTAAATPAVSTVAPLVRGRRREVRRHLLVDARDDPRHVLDTLREDGEDDLRAVRKGDPADEVMVVVSVAGL